MLTLWLVWWGWGKVYKQTWSCKQQLWRRESSLTPKNNAHGGPHTIFTTPSVFLLLNVKWAWVLIHTLTVTLFWREINVSNNRQTASAWGRGCNGKGVSSCQRGPLLSSISCSGTVPIQRPHHPVTLQRQTHRELKMQRRLLAHSAPLLQLGTPHPRIPPSGVPLPPTHALSGPPVPWLAFLPQD